MLVAAPRLPGRGVEVRVGALGRDRPHLGPPLDQLLAELLHCLGSLRLEVLLLTDVLGEIVRLLEALDP